MKPTEFVAALELAADEAFEFGRNNSFQGGARWALTSTLVRQIAARIEAQEQMLVSYRVGRTPSNKTFAAMERTSEVLNAYRQACEGE